MKKKLASKQKINDFIKENHKDMHPMASMPIETVCNIQFKKKWKDVRKSDLNEGEVAYIVIQAINRALYSLNISKNLFENITKDFELEPTPEEKEKMEAEKAEKEKNESEKLNEFLSTILITKNTEVKHKLINIKKFISNLEKKKI